MGWVAVIATVLRIILAWYFEKIERRITRKRLLNNARKALKLGLKHRNALEVFGAWDKVRRARR